MLKYSLVQHLLERLGKGAFGTVHKAIHVGDGRLVAIKIIQIAELPKGYDVETTRVRSLLHLFYFLFISL